jgi:hypothetical protein
MQFKHLAKLLFPLLVFHSYESWAFRPTGHVILQRLISRQLPQGNLYKVAMDAHPFYAAWGAVGPDICYVPEKVIVPKWGYKRKLLRASNYADVAHYYKAGTFSKNLVQAALESKDQNLIAFAAGWLTHVAGDFGSHGIYVHPEAGYYLDNVSGQDHHGEMERVSESVLFVEQGRLLDASFFTQGNLKGGLLYDKFFGKDALIEGRKASRAELKVAYEKIASFVKSVYENTYEEKFDADLVFLMRHYKQAFGGIGRAKGFYLLSYEAAKKQMNEVSNRTVNLQRAFDMALQWGSDLFVSVSNGNYSAFSDSWNLDVGPDAHTMVFRTIIDKHFASGSKNPIYVNLYLDTLHRKPLQFYSSMLGKARYRKSDQLLSYMYLSERDFSPDSTYKFTVSKSGVIKDASAIRFLELSYNGKKVFADTINLKLNRKMPVSREYEIKIR